MADEEDPWGFDEGDSEPAAAAAPAAAASPAPAAAGGTPAPSEGGAESAPVEGEAAPAAAEEEAAPPTTAARRRWVPEASAIISSLGEYKYMYNYRTNYYDDVIDYLDKKQVGVPREIPRAQTWAERVLRSSNTGYGRDLDSYTSSGKRDKHLVQTLAASIRTHNYHTKAYINQKYAHVL